MAADYFSSDTIAAIATPLHAVGALGIIRISGPQALAITEAVTKPHRRGVFKTLESHYLYRCDFLDEEGQGIDDGLFVLMQAPNSFTGEDCVEFHMHGNPHILQRMLERIFSTGLARAAAAGEFSFRGFRNGKMDLSQSEAIADLIAAKSDAAIRSAFLALRGSAGKVVDRIREELLTCLSRVELEIDFSDQGVSHLDFEKLGREISRILETTSNYRERFLKTRPLREGIRTAIVGEPNSGKSTLFNQLLGEDRSIVSDIPGTTRDIVRESVLFGSVLLILADTAGIRESADKIEREGIQRSLVEAGDAHLILAVIDGADDDSSAPAAVKNFLEKISSKNPVAKIILVLNKSDAVEPGLWNKRMEALRDFTPVAISAMFRHGAEDLSRRIFGEFRGLDLDMDSVAISHARHFEVLTRAAEYLEKAQERLQKNEWVPDLLALDLRAAMDVVGEITGHVSSDDVLNHIFSKFCIGK